MFTGLIQGLGRIQFLNEYQLRITPAEESRAALFHDLAVGDSVAVDGICLTVETFSAHHFTVSASPETLGRTALAHQSPEHWVNLETSLRVGSKVGGHFVTGHVDGLGILEDRQQTATSWWLKFGQIDRAIAPFLVAKGSITVNGISLTIADCDAQGDWFSAAVIPHTYSSTNLHYLTLGQAVNLETDILGKYVQRLVQFAPSGSISPPAASALDEDWLKEQGYF